MASKRNPNTNPHAPASYQIRIKGHLGHQWKGWLGDVGITLEEDGYTLLTCQVIDQAALHSLLRQIRDLGMPLISVNRIEPDSTERFDENTSTIE